MTRRGRWLGLMAGLGMGVASGGLWPSGSIAQGPVKPVATAPAAVPDLRLKLIGSLSSRHVYTLYGYIGVVADGAVRGQETPERTESLMSEVGVMTDQLVAELGDLSKTGLTPEDAAAVREMMAIYQLLKEEADAVRIYAKNKTEANGAAFQKKRMEVWPRIARVIGIPEP